MLLTLNFQTYSLNPRVITFTDYINNILADSINSIVYLIFRQLANLHHNLVARQLASASLFIATTATVVNLENNCYVSNTRKFVCYVNQLIGSGFL